MQRADRDRAPQGRQETRLERVDRNLAELNGEMRVVVTGVQVLFAFLLVVPFDAGFRGIGAYERAVYFVTLILSALAALFTLAPASRHRILFREDDKPHLMAAANGSAIAGMVCLALAICGSLLLVASKLFGDGVGAITAAAGVIAFGGGWFALPLARRARVDGRDEGGGHEPA
jgi:hypothetical protein